ncbi:MAG: DUF4433 domain-containing protein [Firmicutes bacterium]|nr:DUF4433 domain-containing protein [Bacillota bacterium]
MPTPTLIYHITHLDNLPQIIQSGGLYSWTILHRDNIQYTNIAHQTIQDRRSTTPVVLPPFGVLHDYVPFYFAPRSPMLCAIYNNKVDDYKGKQHEIIHLVSDAHVLQQAGVPFVFTDGHGIMFITNFYNNLQDLDKIDWGIMRAKYWADTNEDGDRRRRRWSLIIGIGVMNEQTLNRVNEILNTNQQITHKPFIKIKRAWYY